MDLTHYKQAIADGQTVDFYLSKDGFVSLLFHRILSRPLPKVLSVNKDTLTIYDLSIPALWGKSAPCVSVAWKEISRFGTEVRDDSILICLQVPNAISEHIRQHVKSVPGNLFRIYFYISDGAVIFNVSDWLGTSFTEAAALLQELHQAAKPKNEKEF